ADQPSGLGTEQRLDALRAPAVQVDRQVRPLERHRAGTAHIEVVVHRADERQQRAEVGRGGEGDPVLRRRLAQRPQRGDRREQVAQPQPAQHQQIQGHDVSVSGQMTSSLISQPTGRPSANTTAWATSAGSFSPASGPGLYCSGRPSKKPVRMPPGTSRVTPTSPRSSTASARVSPTTPNFEVMWAEASLSGRSPSVDAQVTIRPREHFRYGSAALMTEAVPSRLTVTTCTQSPAGTSSSRPHRSIPAAVTTASRPPARPASSRTARSACSRSATSAVTCSNRWSGPRTSTTSGRQPSFSTASAVARPSPAAPPVINTCIGPP